jgi:hypothetical protein
LINDDNIKCVIILIKEINLKAIANKLIEVAITKGRIKILKILIQQGIDLNKPHFNQEFPMGYQLEPYLFIAVQSNNLETLKIVMERVKYQNEESVIDCTREGNSLISNIFGAAALVGNLDILEHLLENIDIKNLDLEYRSKMVNQQGV